MWCGVDGPAGGVCVVEVGVFNEGDGGVGWEVGGGWGDGCGVARGEGCVVCFVNFLSAKRARKNLPLQQ